MAPVPGTDTRCGSQRRLLELELTVRPRALEVHAGIWAVDGRASLRRAVPAATYRTAGSPQHRGKKRGQPGGEKPGRIKPELAGQNCRRRRQDQPHRSVIPPSASLKEERTHGECQNTAEKGKETHSVERRKKRRCPKRPVGREAERTLGKKSKHEGREVGIPFRPSTCPAALGRRLESARMAEVHGGLAHDGLLVGAHEPELAVAGGRGQGLGAAMTILTAR